MLIVADTSPLNYLVLIGRVELLRELYGRVLVPEAVLVELQDEKAPDAVKQWIASRPDWIEVQAVSGAPDAELLKLNTGEAEAIALAQKLNATTLIIDEKEGRRVAAERGLVVIGLLGVLRDAAARDLIDLAAAFTDLEQTTFRVSPMLTKAILDQDTEGKFDDPFHLQSE